MKQYNGVPLDGRPMNIQVVTSEVPLARSPGLKPSGSGPPRNRGGMMNRRGGGPAQRGKYISLVTMKNF